MDLTHADARSVALTERRPGTALTRRRSFTQLERRSTYHPGDDQIVPRRSKEIDMHLAYGDIPPDLEHRIDLAPAHEALEDVSPQSRERGIAGEKPGDFVERFVEEAFNKGNLDVVDEVYAERFPFVDQPVSPVARRGRRYGRRPGAARAARRLRPRSRPGRAVPGRPGGGRPDRAGRRRPFPPPRLML
jgi:hypothetical protein